MTRSDEIWSLLQRTKFSSLVVWCKKSAIKCHIILCVMRMVTVSPVASVQMKILRMQFRILMVCYSGKREQGERYLRDSRRSAGRSKGHASKGSSLFLEFKTRSSRFPR